MNPELLPVASIVKATSSGDVVGVIPIFLGFRPAASVVVLGLIGRRRAIGPVLRYDVDIAAVDAADQVLPALVNHGVVAVFVAVYSDDDRHCAEAAPAYIDAGRRCGIDVHDVVAVCGGRWHSVLAPDPADEPVPDPATASAAGVTGAVAAIAVAEGRVVLPSRDDLAALIAGPSPDELPAATALIAAAHTEMSAMTGGVDAVHARAMSLLAEEVAHRCGAAASSDDDHASPPTWSPADAAFLAAATSHLGIRDDLATTPELPLAPLLEVLCAVARMAPDIDAVELCCVIAWVALRTGNGALANIALDRALDADPDDTLAATLVQMSAVMPSPDEVEQWTASARAHLTREHGDLTDPW